jgi:hypothetical protein
MDIEELLGSIRSGLPTIENGAFVIMVNYINDIEGKSPIKQKKQFMLLFLRGHRKDDWDQEEESRNLTEHIYKDFLNRMADDSKNGEWDYGFQLPNCKAVPTKIGASTNYVGWQVTFPIVEYHNECVDNAKWTDL